MRGRPDVCRLRDEQSSGNRRALRVVLCSDVGMYAMFVCTEASERCEDYAMAKRDVSDLDGLEERWQTCGAWHLGLEVIEGNMKSDVVGELVSRSSPFGRLL